jgi:hypothetical protein
MSNSEMKSNLDKMINQRLNITMEERSQHTRVEQARRSITSIGNDISGFARFLKKRQCLEVLLFWKEVRAPLPAARCPPPAAAARRRLPPPRHRRRRRRAPLHCPPVSPLQVEQFRTCFTAEDRMKVAEKINDEYCVEGSAWQVNFKGEHAATIEKSVNSCKSGEAKDVEEDLFDSAQDEVYQLMLLDLYPAFVDHIAILGGGRASEEEKGPDTLMDILGGINPAGMRSFERYVRAHFCEEALLFWLEANDFQIRFDKTDLESRAKEIYKDYMGETAKARINTSDECIAKVWEKIEKKAVTNMLFFDAQKEVEQFLDLDIFPRYQEWIAEGGDNEAAATGGDISSLQDESRLGDREKMREAVAQLLLIEVEAKKLRTIAHALDAEENINFYFEILEYKKLFQEQDRKEKAATIWKTFLDAKADRPVTIPDDKHKKIMKVR